MADWIFTLHFDENVAALDVEEAGLWRVENPQSHNPGSRSVLRCDTDDLASLRNAYNELARIAESFDYICGFACGALPLIIHIARAECNRMYGRTAPRTEEEARAIQSKMHVFPGLSWPADARANFSEFLRQLPRNARVLIVDCSFSGGALGAIANNLDSIFAGNERHVQLTIAGIVDQNKLEERKIESCRKLLARGALNDFVMLQVRTLISEDFPKLQGFSSISTEARLNPIWAPGVIVVRNVATGLYLVGASEPLHTVMDELLEFGDGIQQQFCVEETRVLSACAETVAMVLYYRIRRRYDEIITSNETSDAETLLQKKQELCGHWKAESSAIRRQFQYEAELPVPDFCESIENEKLYLAGQKVDITMTVANDHLLISIRGRYKHDLDRVRTDFSFLLTPGELQQAISKQAGLTEAVPEHYQKRFGEMWAQLDGNAVRALEEKWRAAIERARGSG